MRINNLSWYASSGNALASLESASRLSSTRTRCNKISKKTL
jgi:hypothetical protein